MSVLAYCVTGSDVEMAPAVGVEGLTVLRAAVAGLTVFFSQSEAGFRFDSETRVREGALAFHGVNDHIFRECAIVPFRFPTMLSDVAGLEAFVQRNREVFDISLAATRDRVQMELWIYPRLPGPLAGVDGEQAGVAHLGAPATGTAYLTEKAAQWRELETRAAEIRSQAEAEIVDWRQMRQRDCLRCYVLTLRKDAAGFRSGARIADAAGPGFRITGPWPATQFMPLDRLVPLNPLPADALPNANL